MLLSRPVLLAALVVVVVVVGNQYAQYYFSLRHRASSEAAAVAGSGEASATPKGNFRTKLMMRVGVPAAKSLQQRTSSLAAYEMSNKLEAARRAHSPPSGASEHTFRGESTGGHDVAAQAEGESNASTQAADEGAVHVTRLGVEPDPATMPNGH